MTNFFRYDASGQKRGPFNEQQLQTLAAQGKILPTTPLETDTGYKGVAGQIPSLVFNTVPPPQNLTRPPSVAMPVAEKNAGASWQVTLIGLVLLLIVGGIGYKIIDMTGGDSTGKEATGDRSGGKEADAPITFTAAELKFLKRCPEKEWTQIHFNLPSPVETKNMRATIFNNPSTKGEQVMATLDNTTLRNTMKNLAQEHPRFLSERNFRDVLCEKIQSEFPSAEIRFERSATLRGKTNKIDIIVNLGGKLFPIELKRKLERHRAETENRERMLKDIKRLEVLKLENLKTKNMKFNVTPVKIQSCFAIWLSDNHRYWSDKGENSIHEYNGRKITWEAYGDDGKFRFALTCVPK